MDTCTLHLETNPQVLGCLSNCQEYIKAKAQNLISDKVSLDTNQRCKVFNAYRRAGSNVGSNIAFPKSDIGLPPHLDLKSLVDTLTRLIWLTQAMVTISRYFSRKKARTKNYYLEKIVV